MTGGLPTEIVYFHSATPHDAERKQYRWDFKNNNIIMTKKILFC